MASPSFYDPGRAVCEFRHLLADHGHPKFGEPGWQRALREVDERDTASRHADAKARAHYDYDGRNSFRAGFRAHSHLVSRGEGSFQDLLAARCDTFLVSRGLPTEALR